MKKESEETDPERIHYVSSLNFIHGCIRKLYYSLFHFFDSSLYELNFMDAKPSRGFYKVTVSAVPAKADARLIGTTGAQVKKYDLL